jgi:hypothetical protein
MLTIDANPFNSSNCKGAVYPLEAYGHLAKMLS